MELLHALSGIAISALEQRNTAVKDGCLSRAIRLAEVINVQADQDAAIRSWIIRRYASSGTFVNVHLEFPELDTLMKAIFTEKP